MTAGPRARLDVRPYGDTAVLAGVIDEDYESRWATTQAVAAALRGAPPDWLVDLVATYDHLFLTFDPGLGDHESVTAALERAHEERSTAGVPEGRTLEVPVLFGGDAGPDLDDVAEELALSAETLVDRLTHAPWRVRFVAGPVGTPFTDRGDWDVAIPRVPVPRVRVPPGTVALSGEPEHHLPGAVPRRLAPGGAHAAAAAGRGPRCRRAACRTPPATDCATSRSTRRPYDRLRAAEQRLGDRP